MKESWDRLRGRLPNTHNWECNFAKKEKSKDRAKEGFIIGKKKNWSIGEKLGEVMEEGIVISKVRETEKEKDYGIVSIYNGGN